MIKKIAVCDSGIGGLAVLKKLVERFPQFEYYYLSDSKNLPYGNKSKEEIRKYCKVFLDRAVFLKAEILVVACNTMASIGEDIFKNNGEIKTLFIRPALWKILDGNLKKSKIFCTVATSKSAPISSLSNICSDCVLPLENLAWEIEKNIFSLDKIDFNFLQKYRGGVKRIFLCCTHYIHVAKIFQSFFPKAQIFDGTEEILDIFSLLTINQKKKDLKGGVNFAEKGEKDMKEIFFRLQNRR